MEYILELAAARIKKMFGYLIEGDFSSLKEELIESGSSLVFFPVITFPLLLIVAVAIIFLAQNLAKKNGDNMRFWCTLTFFFGFVPIGILLLRAKKKVLGVLSIILGIVILFITYSVIFTGFATIFFMMTFEP